MRGFGCESIGIMVVTIRGVCPGTLVCVSLILTRLLLAAIVNVLYLCCSVRGRDLVDASRDCANTTCHLISPYMCCSNQPLSFGSSLYHL